MLLIFLYFVLLALFLFVNVWAQQGYSKTCNIKYNDMKSTHLEIKCSLSLFEILHQNLCRVREQNHNCHCVIPCYDIKTNLIDHHLNKVEIPPVLLFPPPSLSLSVPPSGRWAVGGRGGSKTLLIGRSLCLYLFRKEMKISCIFTTFSFLVSNNFTTYCLPPRHADLVLSPNSSDLWVRPSLCSSFHFTLSHLSDVKL